MPRFLIREPRGKVFAPLFSAMLLLAPGCAQDPDVGTAPTLPLPTLPPDPVPAWLAANAHPFEGTHLSLPHDDIEFLRDIVGDARIVSLGEHTHGTRDFFEMKARILRFLVEEMDFDAFAIEASWPESRRLGHYVRTGEGDPHELLTGLLFWTWRTESVLEMIEWMREHNEAGGDVGFHGFDMQYPGLALHNVREYVRDVDPERAEAVAGKLSCLTRYANDHRGRFPNPDYEDQPDAYRTQCGASLDEVREALLSSREEYESLAGEDAFQVALQSLRVAFQYHLQATGQQLRDESMAENTEWILRRIGPEGRIVLWAHNSHVSTRPRLQGSYLRQVFGDGMVVVGFSHETGQFTGVDLRPEGERGLPALDLDPVRAGSYESIFERSDLPRFVLDLRNRDTREPGAAWLAERRLFRSIGCCLNPAWPTWVTVSLAEWYDVIIHFKSTGPTTILTPRYPDPW